MNIHKFKSEAGVTLCLRSERSIFDTKGNEIKYDAIAKAYNYGEYEGNMAFMLKQVWFTKNPLLNKRKDVHQVKHKSSPKRAIAIQDIKNKWSNVSPFDIEKLSTCKESEIEAVKHRIEVSCSHREEGENI